MNFYLFVLSGLATWRITHLLSSEDGPLDLIYSVRKQLGQHFFGRLLDCFYCLSIWVALGFGLWLGNTVGEKLLLWAAISGAACLFQKATEKRNQEPSVPFYKEDKN